VKRLCFLVVALAGALLVMLTPATAQDWPTRPVRIVSTFAAGGTADMLARILAEHLSDVFGQQFFVETRAGAGGAIGVQTVATAPPDGYNLVITNVSLLVLAPIINPKFGIDPAHDLTNIAYIAGSPVVLSVNPASGINTLGEFIAQAKGSKDLLTYSSSGVGTMGHLLIESFAQEADIKVDHVPYKGATQGITDLVGGHIAFSAQVLSSTAPQIRGGTLRAIAHAANARLPDYPEVPTFKELGYADLVSTTWFSLSGPAGMPSAMVEKLNREVAHAMAKPDVQRRLREVGLFTEEPMGAAEFKTYIEAETARWKPVIERVGLAAK
jgi:tripartite-type tricarboxylate transporter receptor subunit TctC